MYNRQFWLLCSSNFLFSASFQMMIPELPDYLTQMGGREYIGLIIALFTFTAGISRPFSGKLTDSIGRVPLMILGSLVCFVCSLAYPFVQWVAVFLLLRFLHGFSTGTKPTATAAYIADITPEDRRGEASGMLGIFTATGMSIGPSMGSYIAGVWGITPMFYASAGLALLSILILGRMKETLPNPQAFSLKLLTIKREDIFEPRVIAAFWVMLLTSYSSGVALTLTPDMTKAIGISNKGLFFTVYTVASLITRLFTRKTSDTYGRIPVLLFSSVVLAAGMGCLGIWQTPAAFWASAILFGISWGLNTPTLIAWTIDLSDAQYRGRALATTYMALEAGIGLGALIAGWWFGSQGGSMASMFLGAAGLAVISVVLLIFVPKPRHASS